MTRRLGSCLHWLGLLIAVLAIGGAVAWNVWAFQQRQEAQKNLRTLSPALVERETALAEAFARQRASTKNLQRSVTFGGVLVLGGLFVYGFGWAARRTSRTSNNNRRE